MKGLYIVSHLAPYRDKIIEIVNLENNHCIHTYSIYKKANTHPEWEYINSNSLIHFFNQVKELPIFGTWNTDVIKVMKKNDDMDFYILGGYRPATLTYSIFKAIKDDKPFIYSTDKKEFGTKFGDKVAQFICNRAKAVWVPGKASKDYLKSIGVDDKKIYIGCYTNSHKELVNDIKNHIYQRDNIRESMGISSDDIVFLFIGKLIATRNVGNLIKAFKNMTKDRKIKLLVIGDGPDIHLVQGVRNVISIKQCPYNELYRYYMCADAYVHPGNEPYSLALADAAVAGLPIVSTSGVGAAVDVIENGQNGFIVPENNIVALENAIMSIYDKNFDSNMVISMQQHLLNNRDIDWAASQLMKSIERCNKI